MSEDREYEEARLLYSCTVDELGEFKAQQWRVANYFGLAMAALFGAVQVVRISEPVAWAIAAVVGMVGIFSCIVLRELQSAIARRRSRLRRCRGILRTVSELRADGPAPKSYVPWLLGGFVLAGAFITASLIILDARRLSSERPLQGSGSWCLVPSIGIAPLDCNYYSERHCFTSNNEDDLTFEFSFCVPRPSGRAR